jgi:pyrroloquinoline quinone biosynthesis protein B
VHVRVLGSAAGGGFPQWNCGCANCRGVRAGTIDAVARTQESIAVSACGARWVVINASPEIRQQIEACPALHPRGPRHSPIAAIVLTNGDLDHCLGLLSLRESQPLVVYATDRVRRGFTEDNVLCRTLERFEGQLTWRPLPLGRAVAIDGVDGPTGVIVEAVAVPGKPPLHLARRLGAPDPEDNVGLRVGDVTDGALLAYVPGAAAVTDDVRAALADAACVFFDGTFWSDDELVRAGLGDRTAAAMAHVPVGGPDGSLDALAMLTAPTRLFTHLNNTQPLLRRDSEERAAVLARGWDVAADGMELVL